MAQADGLERKGGEKDVIVIETAMHRAQQASALGSWEPGVVRAVIEVSNHAHLYDR
jgi:hypothetical protein